MIHVFYYTLRPMRMKCFCYAGCTLEVLGRIENLVKKFIPSPACKQNTFKETSSIFLPKLKEKR